MSIIKPSILGSICTIGLLQGTLHAGVVYSQPTVSSDADVGFGWYSASEPRPTRSFKHADNFVLAADSAIDAVRWWGLSEGVTHTDLSNFDSFTIEFYTSRTLPNGNIRPMELIASTTAGIDETSTQTTGRSAPSGAMEFVHELELNATVELLAGETYWIAISARSIDPSADAWQWQDSDDYDTLSSSFDYNQNRWVVLQDTDSAYELIAVPSPSSSMVLLMGCLGIHRRARRCR